jgi:hypothetical protein
MDVEVKMIPHRERRQAGSRDQHLEPVTGRTRDNLPNPVAAASNPYVPVNMPTISDLFEMFDFNAGDDDLSLLKGRPARLICILRTDQLSRRSWSDGSETSSGQEEAVFERTASWHWRTWRCGSNSPCGRRASHGRGLRRRTGSSGFSYRGCGRAGDIRCR